MSEEPLDSQPFMALLVEFRDRMLLAIAGYTLSNSARRAHVAAL